MVDPRDDEVGPHLHDAVDRQVDGVGGRPVDGEVAVVQLLDPQRPIETQRMARRALLAIGRHHPDVAERCQRRFERADAGGANAVVIGDQNAHRGTLPAPPRAGNQGSGRVELAPPNWLHARCSNGAWRSLVAHSLGVRVVGRSNRLAPTDAGARSAVPLPFTSAAVAASRDQRRALVGCDAAADVYAGGRRTPSRITS